MTLEKCPDCHKYWERTWNGTEYCPNCGQTKDQAIERIERDRAEKKQKKPDAAPKVTLPLYTPEQQYIRDLLSQMHQEHGYAHYPTVFRNIKRSYTHNPNEVPQIVLGYADLNRVTATGFTEYVSIAHVWRGQGDLTGLRGAWALGLHEFAHVVQFQEDRLYSQQGHRNKFHNEQFVEILSELQILYPFDETT